ncbi:MATE family multidrug resistance protein [Idiomarina fontislapidosi]|uniref:MATE family efflux transporter n=1 Tax=Idiomarina fontislapidosi TaxID=263723 RepID=A0A432XTW8_9GAMM|nr:MATE family efflux transporter [Idiomarina fontislapidosi]PYE31542.1 MATE family multidrug resistance protein [Idiomarina fontislapidosi]RUO52176.1 MATE family efflux transporter [Idiomarina fontislapidosi]
MQTVFGFARADHRRVFAIALPMIISNIAAPLLGLVDTAIIGHLPNSVYLSSVAIGAMVVSFLYLLAVFLRMATTGAVAQAFGARDHAEQHQLFTHGLFTALLLGAIIIALSPFITSFSLWLVAPDPQLLGYASDYIQIRLWSAPAALTTLICLGVLLGRQDSRTAMWLVIITNLVNVILDLILIVGLDMNVRGAAYASLCAEWATAIVGFYWCRKTIGWEFSKARIVISKLRLFLQANGNIFVRSLTLQLCMAMMTGYAARYGTTIVAANAVLMQFLMLISLGLDGIAYAVEALAGEAKGKKRPEQVRYWCRITLLWSALFAIGYSLLFWLFGQHIIGLITDLSAVVNTAMTFLPWVVALPLLAHWSYWLDGVFIGLSWSKGMRDTMLLAAITGFIPLWWLSKPLENHGLWLALSGFLIMRAVYQTLWLLRRGRQIV